MALVKGASPAHPPASAAATSAAFESCASLPGAHLAALRSSPNAFAVAGCADGREASVEERELRRAATMGAQHRGIMAPAKSPGDGQKRG